MKKITFFILKVEDTGLEASADGIEKLNTVELEALGVQRREYIDAETLKIYLASNPHLPVGCELTVESITLITEQLQT